MESQILLQLQLPFQKGLSIHFSSIYVITKLSSICGGGATGSDHVRISQPVHFVLLLLCMTDSATRSDVFPKRFPRVRVCATGSCGLPLFVSVF